MRESEDSGGTGGIVVRAVIDDVGAGNRALAKMIEVCGEKDDLVGPRTAAKDPDGVPGLLARRILKFRQALLKSLRKRIGKRGFLEESAVIPARLQPECLELRCGKECSDVLIARGGAPAV